MRVGIEALLKVKILTIVCTELYRGIINWKYPVFCEGPFMANTPMNMTRIMRGVVRVVASFTDLAREEIREIRVTMSSTVDSRTPASKRYSPMP